MSFAAVFQKMVELFLIIIVGYIARKTSIIDSEGRGRLSKLVLNVTMPATMLASVMTAETFPETGQLIQLLCVSALSYVILFGFAFIVPKLLRIKQQQVGIYRFMLAFGNVGFIGFPVTEAVFGIEAVFYASIFNLPFNLLAYSIGVGFIKESAKKMHNFTQEEKRIFDKKQESIQGKIRLKNKRKQIEAIKQSSTILKQTWNLQKIKEILFTPCMVASILALLIAAFQISTPMLISETMSMLSGVTTPVALLIIGAALAEMPVKEMFSNPKIYIFTVIRLLALPMVTYVCFCPFITDKLLLGVCTIIAAMPVATSGTMLCLQYQSDEKLMAQGTFLSTLFSVVTIPFIAVFLQS